MNQRDKIMAKILIIDDEINIQKSLGEILSDEGHDVLTAADGEKGLTVLKNETVDLVLLDVKLPGIDGLEVLKRVKENWPEIEVVMISGHGTIEAAVEAMKSGAYDFMEKPLSMKRVLITAEHALERGRFSRERKEWLDREDKRYQIIGESPPIKKIWEDIQRVARTNARVLIVGESGTGKELVAYWIHRLSDRCNKSLVKVNCAAIPKELIESELFGYEKGAFTGAVQRKIGKFELADKGTIFLDEVGDMDQHTQAKVLRVLEDGEFQRIGGLSSIKADVRIVTATNKVLPEEIKKGNFRSDLYHRINVFQIYISPLRERRMDIPILAKYFLDTYSIENGLKQRVLNKESEAYISTLNFPGNVRELRNLVERAIISSGHEVITVEDLKSNISAGVGPEEDIFAQTKKLGDAKHELEKKYIETQLAINGWNISKTAEKLGVERSNLSRRIKQLGIEAPD